MILNIEY